MLLAYAWDTCFCSFKKKKISEVFHQLVYFMKNMALFCYIFRDILIFNLCRGICKWMASNVDTFGLSGHTIISLTEPLLVSKTVQVIPFVTLIRGNGK